MKILLPDAACRGVDPNLFFPGPGASAQHRQALAYCEACPDETRSACLEGALAVDPIADVGIFGGTSALGRRKIRKARRTTQEAAA